ncbi:hypothetical protein [Streptomyces sp. 5-6(2022)]|uniref:hypothetical protein n=1 Tax=Streptomyces sp. 5-6(2022) TaxID=2936510 RepID=UPI0023B90ADF|nr:hypothetical protein [Streptomyces sp. 5-6(2022)]
MSADPVLTAYGAVVAALRGDHDGTRALLADLPPDALLEVADAAILAMGDAVRSAMAPQHINDMIRTLQGFALEEQQGEHS